MPLRTLLHRQHEHLANWPPAQAKELHPKKGRFPEIDAIKETNRQWAQGVQETEPEFLEKQTQGQFPNILWIGCADSRVPESVILGRRPGEIFVHRNIANQFQKDDDSANSLLQYGVLTVGCTHVIVCGHTGCGGCVAAWGAPGPLPSNGHTPGHDETTPLLRFLDPVVRLRHSLPKEAEVDDLIQANVRDAVKNVVASDTIKEAWEKARRGEMPPVYVHGWVYHLDTGLIEDMDITVGPASLEEVSN